MKVLVVAKYKEDIEWLTLVPRERPNGFRIFVYDKGDGAQFYDKCDFAYSLNNYPGREAHTYMEHIVRLYYRPMADTVFCQGAPHPHDPLFLEHLSDDSIRTYGDIYECPSDGGPHMVNANLDELCLRVGVKPRSTYRFIAGCQFRVTAEQIRQHPIEVYEFLLAYSKLGTTPHCAWTLERFLPTLFGIL